jgi:hypothetical protein
MTQARHLVTVWNPSYADDAMDAHLRVLLRSAERARTGQGVGDGANAAHAADAEASGSGDAPYVWWAKVRSPNRQQPLPHADDILAIQDQIEAGVETHLYLTDYRSLYVAELDEITTDRIRADTPGEKNHLPEYYEGMLADMWFRLLDIRRIVSDDTPAVIAELKQLRNTRYNDRPVSLYGGMVDLPLFVTRDMEKSWFADREALLDEKLWAERDARHHSARLVVAEDPLQAVLAGCPQTFRPERPVLWNSGRLTDHIRDLAELRFTTAVNVSGFPCHQPWLHTLSPHCSEVFQPMPQQLERVVDVQCVLSPFHWLTPAMDQQPLTDKAHGVCD